MIKLYPDSSRKKREKTQIDEKWKRRNYTWHYRYTKVHIGTITNDMWINGQILKKVYSSMTESGWNGKYEKTNYQ